ncbi:hypothetical protein [Pararhizobium antarcticum]|uniref:Uncharacterized protein n=1 Tax=Pararhizobium antarcticum TaxID=1798805 RepID=A0A657LXD8_9HYPH|nr:hypothetical protein [Pararhizobium antarcticum]OJF97611.1 hypothetical protein AX760_16760 [Pararhizobium antarcticum]
MRIIETLGAQGEIRMFRVDEIPGNAVPMKKENGHFIIGHSETGHHHVLEAERVQVFQQPDAPQGMTILFGILESPGSLTHLRGHDTHAPHAFEPGDKIMFRTDREYDPYAELARRVAD